MRSLSHVVILFVWIAGIVLAKGFWSTFFAVLVPFWAIYLVIEQIMIKYIL